MNKTVYKWQIVGNKFLYITDENGNGPFIYSEGNSTPDDNAIARYVSSQVDKNTYSNWLTEAQGLLSEDDDGKYLRLGGVDIYYNVAECNIKNDSFNPVFMVHATAEKTNSKEVQVETYYTEINGGRDTILNFHIPNGPQGYKGEMAESDFSYLNSLIPEPETGSIGAKGPKGNIGPIGDLNTGYTITAESGITPIGEAPKVTYRKAGNNGSIFTIPVGPQGDDGRDGTNMWKGTFEEYNEIDGFDEEHPKFFAIVENGVCNALYANDDLIIPTVYLQFYNGNGYNSHLTPLYIGSEQLSIPIRKEGTWTPSGATGNVVSNASINEENNTLTITPNTAATYTSEYQDIPFVNSYDKKEPYVRAYKIGIDVYYNGYKRNGRNNLLDSNGSEIAFYFSGTTELVLKSETTGRILLPNLSKNGDILDGGFTDLQSGITISNGDIISFGSLTQSTSFNLVIKYPSGNKQTLKRQNFNYYQPLDEIRI